MTDNQSRALRTLVQVGFVQLLIQLYNAFAPEPLTVTQVTAIVLVATPLVTFLQNWFEDNTALPTILGPTKK